MTRNKVSPNIAPCSEQKHQLNALPPLAPESAIYNNPVLMIVCLYIASVIGVIIVCRNHPEFSAVATTFITVGTSFFTVAVGAIGVDKVARKGIYAIAANKNGITAIPAEKNDEPERQPEPFVQPPQKPPEC